MASAIGSVFLGDVQRSRLLSSPSSPPSSPPPHISPTAMSSFHDLDLDSPDEEPTSPVHENAPAAATATANTSATTDASAGALPPSVPPVLSLDLRVRWLETLLFGARPESRSSSSSTKAAELKAGETLARRAEELQRKFDAIVQGNDGLKKFMEHYEQYAHLLTPSFALSGTLPTAAPAYQSMAPGELEALLAEMEPDIRAADRDLRDISLLENKGVTGAGKLADYKTLQPRLQLLVQAHEEDARKAAELEKRVAALMDRYATQVDTLSELFVAWDDTVREAEEHVSRLEYDRDERRRLGYE